MNQDAIIVIATHKEYKMPKDKLYLPLHVGAEGKTDAEGNELDIGYIKDNTGDNISNLNASFCELTGLYWAWKNLDYDYIGLAHYRRHFMYKKKSKDSFDNVVKYDELIPLLKGKKIILPKKRNYYIETLYTHYAHTHYASQLDETRRIIIKQCPEYVDSFDKVVQMKSGHMFNMAIMQKSILDDYCSWLFAILFELQTRVDASELSAFQARYPGRVSEILLNVWLDYKIECGEINKAEIGEIKHIHMEKTNWFKKGAGFLKAKFFHKRYEASS